MASELSQFIESELRQKGYAYEDDEDNPHANLIGALRVEVWSDKHEQQQLIAVPGGMLPAGLNIELSVQRTGDINAFPTGCRLE